MIPRNTAGEEEVRQGRKVLLPLALLACCWEGRGALGQERALKKGMQGWQVEVRPVCTKEVGVGGESRMPVTVLGSPGGWVSYAMMSLTCSNSLAE